MHEIVKKREKEKKEKHKLVHLIFGDLIFLFFVYSFGLLSLLMSCLPSVDQ